MVRKVAQLVGRDHIYGDAVALIVSVGMNVPVRLATIFGKDGDVSGEPEGSRHVGELDGSEVSQGRLLIEANIDSGSEEIGAEAE